MRAVVIPPEKSTSALGDDRLKSVLTMGRNESENQILSIAEEKGGPRQGKPIALNAAPKRGQTYHRIKRAKIPAADEWQRSEYHVQGP